MHNFVLIHIPKVSHFRSMMKNAGKTGIEKHVMRPGDLQHLMLDYEDALEQLPHILKVGELILATWEQTTCTKYHKNVNNIEIYYYLE